MKKILILTVALFMIFGGFSHAKGRLQIEIDGIMEDCLINIQHFEMIPIGIPAAKYGYTAEYIEDSKKIVLTRGDESIIFEKDDNRVFINGREKLMVTKAVLRDNKIYVPIEVFRLCFNKSIIFDRELNAMIVGDISVEVDNTPNFGENLPRSKFSEDMIEERSW